jgi:hypothetical protein
MNQVKAGVFLLTMELVDGQRWALNLAALRIHQTFSYGVMILKAEYAVAWTCHVAWWLGLKVVPLVDLKWSWPLAGSTSFGSGAKLLTRFTSLKMKGIVLRAMARLWTAE